MTNEELERAAGNLAGLARDLERYDPWSGTRSKSDATDLRAILSERAELLAAVERMRHELVTSGMHIETSPGAYEDRAKRIVQNIRAALTTGEDTTPNAGERG